MIQLTSLKRPLTSFTKIWIHYTPESETDGKIFLPYKHSASHFTKIFSSQLVRKQWDYPNRHFFLGLMRFFFFSNRIFKPCKSKRSFSLYTCTFVIISLVFCPLLTFFLLSLTLSLFSFLVFVNLFASVCYSLLSSLAIWSNFYGFFFFLSVFCFAFTRLFSSLIVVAVHPLSLSFI